MLRGKGPSDQFERMKDDNNPRTCNVVVSSGTISLVKQAKSPVHKDGKVTLEQRFRRCCSTDLRRQRGRISI